MNKNRFIIPLLFSVFLLLATSVHADSTIDGKWYTQPHLEIGKRVFENNCSICHGLQGQGLAEDWKQPLADGSYPPPPLNGTAHTWHHPVSILIRTITHGGAALGGKMPAFDNKLSNEEKIAVIAYFQHWWPEEIYNGWIERGGLEQ